MPISVCQGGCGFPEKKIHLICQGCLLWVHDHWRFHFASGWPHIDLSHVAFSSKSQVLWLGKGRSETSLHKLPRSFSFVIAAKVTVNNIHFFL